MGELGGQPYEKCHRLDNDCSLYICCFILIMSVGYTQYALRDIAGSRYPNLWWNREWIFSVNSSKESLDKIPSTTGALPEYKAGSVKLEPQDQDDYTFNRKYRITYYQIWGEFTELLSEEEYQDYMEWVDQKAKKDGYGEFQNEMLLVSFIKRYKIPREEFNQAVEKYIANSKASACDLSSEAYEVPNGDIIYTFDNEVINRYYRYA